MNNRIDSGDIVEVDGYRFRVTFEADQFSGMPWENSDGHGPVRRSNRAHYEGRSDKQPGERPLNSPNRNEYQYYYDWAAACGLAKRDGWDTEPYGAPNRIERAVQADFDYLRLFLADDWEYVLVEVRQVDAEGEPIGDSDLCGGVESYKDYHCEHAREMIAYMAQVAKREASERRHMEERDICTI